MPPMQTQPLSMQKAAKSTQKRRRNISFKCKPGWRRISLIRLTAGKNWLSLFRIHSLAIFRSILLTSAINSQLRPTISCWRHHKLIAFHNAGLFLLLKKNIKQEKNVHHSVIIQSYSAWIYSLNSFFSTFYFSEHILFFMFTQWKTSRLPFSIYSPAHIHEHTDMYI